MDESRDSTRPQSPIRRSSSLESCTRNTSPVNFSAALNTEDKVKDRTTSDKEGDEGSQKKVSAAQYQLFRQAVTSSKGTFKVNPSKSRRAPRASLMDLGETEASDRVSWLDQLSLVDTMASTARIAQGLKDDEEVEKTTLSETLNTSSSTFKHLSVKQIFLREPYRLKVHRDVQYLPKPPAENGFSDTKAPASYQISQCMVQDTEELASRSAIYASLADSMVASVIEELSPKDQRLKLLLEKLTIIQEAQVSAVSAGFAADSNLQLLRRDALLKKFGFQPQVLSTVRTAPFEGSHVLGPDPKELQNRVRAIRQADRMAGSSVTLFRRPKTTRLAQRRHHLPRRASPEPPSFIVLVRLQLLLDREPWQRSSPFVLAPSGGPATDPTQINAARLRRLLQLPLPGGVDGVQVGARLADFAPQWRSLPGHRHCRGRGGSYVPSKTSANPPVHQLPDQKQPARPPASRGCLAVEGGHRAGHQRDIPRVLQPTVSGSQEDGRFSSGDRSFHSQTPYGSSTLQNGDTGIRPCSHQKSRVNSVHSYPRRISTCPYAPSRLEVSALCGQQESLPIHLSTLQIGIFTSRVHQALATSRSDDQPKHHSPWSA